MGTKCDNTVCENRGVCVQQWNSYECDCETTTFTGPSCKDGINFLFFFFLSR